MTIYKQVPIEEELPPIGEDVFALHDKDGWNSTVYLSDNGHFYNSLEPEDCPCYPTHWLRATTLPTEEEIIQKVIDYIGNDSEIAIPIEEFFDENGEGITKKQYGRVLLKILCQEITDKFITKKAQATP